MTRHQPTSFRIYCCMLLALAVGFQTNVLAQQNTSTKATVSTKLPSDPPADRNASANARAVLAFLQQLPLKKTQRLVSGQFVGWTLADCRSKLNKAVTKTERFPALVGVDYYELPSSAFHSAAIPKKSLAPSVFQPEAWSPFLIDYWRQGGLVTISLCMNNPWTGNNLFDVKGGGSLGELLDSSTAGGSNYLAQLKAIGDGLAVLNEAGVVVLLRPFPEMSHRSFWWGAKSLSKTQGVNDTQTFRELWRHLFNYLTMERGLHNLLWVFAPVPALELEPYYPGGDFVDVVGFSFYSREQISPGCLTSYNKLLKLGKPLAFTENGPGNPLPVSGDFDLDYLAWLRAVQEHMPMITYFQCWRDGWGLAANRNTRELMADPRVITRESLSIPGVTRQHP